MSCHKIRKPFGTKNKKAPSLGELLNKICKLENFDPPIHYDGKGGSRKLTKREMDKFNRSSTEGRAHRRIECARRRSQ